MADEKQMTQTAESEETESRPLDMSEMEKVVGEPGE